MANKLEGTIKAWVSKIFENIDSPKGLDIHAFSTKSKVFTYSL